MVDTGGSGALMWLENCWLRLITDSLWRRVEQALSIIDNELAGGLR